MSFSNTSGQKARALQKRQPQKVLAARYDSLQSLKSNSPKSFPQLARVVSTDEEEPENLRMSSLSLGGGLSKFIHLFYDASLAAQHVPVLGSDTEYERPERVKVIYEHLKKSMGAEFGSAFREFGRSDLETILTKDMLQTCHTASYLDGLSEIPTLTQEQHRILETKWENDVFINETTYDAAITYASGILDCVRRVTQCREDSNKAVAIGRPPGHHACGNKAMGFCFLANVAIAAKLAMRKGWARKVLIIDWDIHHGNGTQSITYNDPNVLYISLHRQGVGSQYFYPGTGSPSETGNPTSAPGSNLNIAWNHRLMGNTDYLAAWSEIVLPVVRNFSPDLTIISSGFDAAKGDLIGDCLLTPEAYYLMTSSLITLLPSTPIVIAMEGGYNLEVIPLCMEAVIMGLTGESWDEDGTENPLAMLSSPQPKHKSRISLSTDTLVRARIKLNKYWDYYEENPRSRAGKSLAKGAVASINKVVEVILEGGDFGTVSVRKIREQIQKRDGLGKRGKAKVIGKDFLGAKGMDSLVGALG
eukprot:CAMPEP_0118643748 /NCGR_PEP_ID=MMETSP0785-20121206/6558_1 /TAXON_ID=91992 /ORGANISM="Bolidomonas pacifica, Strain CCMP 1866" /LENGTH=530 /DNA_ID=CAMNT_0006535435 /DNA_START=150 /DNA_END=1739 /DNA_ORIENTATION=+